MIKNTGAKKSKLRSRSMKKPLRDVSNGRISVTSCGMKKISGEDGGEKGGDSFDRLLLVHSDISSLLRQIDELVVQALQSESNEGWKEIKQFADVLSDMQATLKPWFPKIRNAFSDENKPEQSIEQTIVSVPKESDNAMESPKPTKWESLLSPSPLVSWRAEPNIEGGGKQLFLLTPLPQSKSFSSTAVVPPEMGADLPETESAKPPASPLPANYPKNNCSMFVMNPCLKMSPPKSCILLEPVSTKKKQGVVQNPDSVEAETSSSDLNVKYPELCGINMNNLGNSVATDDSPDWLVSPPKSCAIMEPLDDKRNDNRGIVCALDLAESTPMMRSIARIGRRDPGENTLKRELWMKFEAASSHDIVHSILRSVTKKGFLDRLEEAFGE